MFLGRSSGEEFWGGGVEGGGLRNRGTGGVSWKRRNAVKEECVGGRE